MALSDPKKRKKKDESKGENLSKAPKDGGFNLPTLEYQEKSTLLVESSKTINVRTTKASKVTFHVTSLDLEEMDNLKAFINERKIKFAWTYVDMRGLEPKLVVHHLAIFPIAKPIMQKLHKMHP